MFIPPPPAPTCALTFNLLRIALEGKELVDGRSGCFAGGAGTTRLSSFRASRATEGPSRRLSTRAQPVRMNGCASRHVALPRLKWVAAHPASRAGRWLVGAYLNTTSVETGTELQLQWKICSGFGTAVPRFPLWRGPVAWLQLVLCERTKSH